MATYKGGCTCNKVRYETTADPARMVNCHCRDCQRASGSAYAPLLFFPADKVKLVGELRYYSATSNRGNTVDRGFCANCGNPIALKLSGRPELLIIQAASLDDPSLYHPERNLWAGSAAPWDHMDPNIPRFEQHPT